MIEKIALLAVATVDASGYRADGVGGNETCYDARQVQVEDAFVALMSLFVLSSILTILGQLRYPLHGFGGCGKVGCR